MARQQYPSDHRRWFRVMEDILDDPGYRNLKPADKVAWLDLLALFNRYQAHRTGNTIVLPWSRAQSAMGAQNKRAACVRASRLARDVGVCFARVPEGLLCLIPAWAQMQGGLKISWERVVSRSVREASASAARPHPPNSQPIDIATGDSAVIPCTTPTPTPTTTTADAVGALPPQQDLSGWVRMLKGEIPTGLNGQTWDTPAAWLADQGPIIAGEAQAKTGEESGKKFNGAFKAILMRYWNHKSPKQQQGDLLDARRNPITAAVRNIREGAERAERSAGEAHAAIPASSGRRGEPTGLH